MALGVAIQVIPYGQLSLGFILLAREFGLCVSQFSEDGFFTRCNFL